MLVKVTNAMVSQLRNNATTVTINQIQVLLTSNGFHRYAFPPAQHVATIISCIFSLQGLTLCLACSSFHLSSLASVNQLVDADSSCSFSVI